MAARYERGLFDPEAARGHLPVRPHHLGHRRRRLPAGGHLRRGVLAGRPPEARQPGAAVGRQPHLHRGRHRDGRLRGHPQALRGVRLARPARRARSRTATSTRTPCTRRSQAAKAETERPSFIAIRSIIAWPAPNAQNTEAAHGSALGDDEVAATKRVLGFDPEQTFEVSDEVLAHTREALDRGREAQAEWEKRFAAWRDRQPGARRRVRPDRRGRAARRAGRSAAGLRGRQGRRHPRRLRQGPAGARRGHPRAVGRLRRPGRLEQHHHRQDVLVPPGGQPAAGGGPVRPHDPLRHPRARHGRGR